MRSLQVLCDDAGFPDVQKKRFRTEVDALLTEGGMGVRGALFCLNQLACRYSVGGHSCGRSLRSCIQIKVSGWLDADDSIVAEPIMQRAKTVLSILVAMHYDYEYINRNGWFDYCLEDISWIPWSERAIVTAAAIALGIDDIPSLDEWNNERIATFLNEC
jgi:hypothetical protein